MGMGMLLLRGRYLEVEDKRGLRWFVSTICGWWDGGWWDDGG
jgi:hypothetical protein